MNDCNTKKEIRTCNLSLFNYTLWSNKMMFEVEVEVEVEGHSKLIFHSIMFFKVISGISALILTHIYGF